MTGAMTDESSYFYLTLDSFTDFNSLSEDAHYRTLPEDWYIVICDIRGSTKAIAEGRYQDVNTLGAASIAALGNIWSTDEIPFVFGGDGASILVPPNKLSVVQSELLKLKNFALANYDMEMRVGVVPMKEVAEAKLPVEVAKYVVASTRTIALIRGGGLSWAETKIKSEPETYCLVPPDNGVLEELQGLSCRWEPLASQKGSIVSLLVRSRQNETRIFAEVLKKLESIIGGKLQSASPVSKEAMKYKSLKQVLKTEWIYVGRLLSKKSLNRLVSVLVSVWSFDKQRTSLFDSKSYTDQIPSHSDYRKFDDMLRMVIDCTPKQVKEIRDYLTGLHASGQIYFGLHESSHALMTCLVGNLSEGGHIHFVDGGDGGYAIAAKYLKDQMSHATENKGH